MSLAQDQVNSLLISMKEIKNDLRDDLREVKKDIHADIKDVNTTINVLAQDVGEVRGELRSAAKQLSSQNKTIKDLYTGQTANTIEINYLKKKRGHKNRSIVPSIFKNPLTKKIVAYSIIGLIILIGLAGYLFFTHLFGQEIMVKVPLS